MKYGEQMREKSVEEKRMIGTYRKDRDQKREISLNSEKVLSWDCPSEIKSVSTWNEIVPSLCGLGFVYVQDKETLYQAFLILDRIHYVQTKLKELEVKINEKPEDDRVLQRYKIYVEMQRKDMNAFDVKLKEFFVGPKERMKIALELNQIIEKAKSPLERFVKSEVKINPKGRDGKK